ncbi:FadR/GntR family transcriptional regulator [Amycolatopsis sp. RTGN1]|uniref:FadR/GntR family transcriptional regulator n=1 Tax=Amycolatopsis ponsaeliensis TaxID=2992142 RepID=UPI00254C3367|nr:FadR/GntR family transcriptional regulator [Amycolatopsis sp. RTGN1]
MSESAPFPFVPRRIDTRGAAEQIAGELREEIAAGRWHPGDRLPAEWQLAEGYGVSRGTVREALRILTSRSLIRSTRGASGGTFVIAPRAEEIADQIGDYIVLHLRAGELTPAEVYHARRILERECVRLAAQHRTDDDLAAIAAPVERVRADPDIDTDEWLAADVAFHTAIAAAAKNRILELAMTAVHAVRPRTNLPLRVALDRDTVWSQHSAIFEAIRDQRPVDAVAALEAHVDYLDSLAGANSGERLARLEPDASPSAEGSRHSPGQGLSSK